MRGIKPSDYPHLADRDVELVRAEAAHLFIQDGDGFSYLKHRNPGLGIIAVIGKPIAEPLLAELASCRFDSAVLLEIGIGKSRPYHDARRPKDCADGNSVWLPKRRKWFALAPEQYRAIAPEIFKLMQELTDRKIAARKCHPGNPFLISYLQRHYCQNTKRYSERTNTGNFPQGTRYCADLRDGSLLDDLYFATLFGNAQVARHMTGAANYICRCLNRYKKNGYGTTKFAGLKRVDYIRKTLDSAILAPDWLKQEVLFSLPDGRGYRMQENLLEYFGVSCETYPEKKQALQALRSGAKMRLENIQLRVLRSAKNQAVFEVTASDNYRRFLPPQDCSPPEPPPIEGDEAFCFGEDETTPF